MRDCQQLIGLTVAGTDRAFGRLTDLCFDDQRWLIRYLMVDATAGSGGPVALPVEHVEPAGETSHAVGANAALEPTRLPLNRGLSECSCGNPASPGLQRVEEVRGYRVVARDCEVGAIAGFLINEAAWSIEYLIVKDDVDRRLILVPASVDTIDRLHARVSLGMTQREALEAPEFADDIEDAYERLLMGQLLGLASPVAH